MSISGSNCARLLTNGLCLGAGAAASGVLGYQYASNTEDRDDRICYLSSMIIGAVSRIAVRLNAPAKYNRQIQNISSRYALPFFEIFSQWAENASSPTSFNSSLNCIGFQTGFNLMGDFLTTIGLKWGHGNSFTELNLDAEVVNPILWSKFSKIWKIMINGGQAAMGVGLVILGIASKFETFDASEIEVLRPLIISVGIFLFTNVAGDLSADKLMRYLKRQLGGDSGIDALLESTPGPFKKVLRFFFNSTPLVTSFNISTLYVINSVTAIPKYVAPILIAPFGFLTGVTGAVQRKKIELLTPTAEQEMREAAYEEIAGEGARELHEADHLARSVSHDLSTLDFEQEVREAESNPIINATPIQPGSNLEQKARIVEYVAVAAFFTLFIYWFGSAFTETAGQNVGRFYGELGTILGSGLGGGALALLALLKFKAGESNLLINQLKYYFSHPYLFVILFLMFNELSQITDRALNTASITRFSSGIVSLGCFNFYLGSSIVSNLDPNRPVITISPALYQIMALYYTSLILFNKLGE